jgi:hypothetical protein
MQPFSLVEMPHGIEANGVMCRSASCGASTLCCSSCSASGCTPLIADHAEKTR